jgi:hypothetical protein
VTELQRWARAAFGSASEMQARDGVEGANLFGREFSIEEVTRLADGRGIVARALQQQVAPLGVARMWTASIRVVELLDRLVAVTLPVRASAYLMHAAQLYIWGFDAQVFPMARSVLEAALKDRIPTVEVYRRRGEPVRFIEVGGKKVLREPTLEDRIEAVEAKPMLVGQDVVDAMRMIKDDGNDILHDFAQPGYTRHGNAVDVLASLAEVLHALYGGRP